MAKRFLRAKKPTPPVRADETSDPTLDDGGLEQVRSFDAASLGYLYHVEWSADGTLLAASGRSVKVWEINSNREWPIPYNFKTRGVLGLAWHPRRRTLAIGGERGDYFTWDPEAKGIRTLGTIGSQIRGIYWSPNGDLLAISGGDGSISIVDAETGELRIREVIDSAELTRPCWSAAGTIGVGSLSGNLIVIDGSDLTVARKWRLDQRVRIWDVDLSGDGRTMVSVSDDQAVRVWDVATGAERAILESVNDSCGVRFSPDDKYIGVTSSSTTQIWRRRDWERVAEISLGVDRIGGLDFNPVQSLVALKSGTSHYNSDIGLSVRLFRIDYNFLDRVGADPGSRRYMNAKIVLVGDTGVGKSGLGLVLSGQPYQPTDSTHARNVWTFDTRDVDVPGQGTQTREALLWDLAGQPGYRLVHQLHLNEVAVALVVFDARSETDPFSGVKYWIRALTQARRLDGTDAFPLRCYLVAARADRGGIGVSRPRIDAMISELGLDGFFETSAKEGWQIPELAETIRDSIPWDALPTVSSTELFESIKQFLLEEKQQGRLLSTADDLFRAFVRAQPDSTSYDQLRASFETCIGRVESRGLIRLLHFGDLVLLQPELLDSYASAMVQVAKDEPEGLGFILEEEALSGRFRLPDSERLTDKGQEKLLLIATVGELLRHEIALKEATDRGVNLVFPSQFTRERPDAPEIPGTAVTFTFEGSLYGIYATLAVRLSQSTLFRRRDMWQNAASYETPAGGVCGIHLRELEEARGELALFYDEQAPAAIRDTFEAYVAEHLQVRALPGTVSSWRTRTCPVCGYALPAELVRRRLDRGSTSIRCPDCEQSVIALTDAEAPAAPSVAVAQMNRSADQQRNQSVAATRLKGKVETDDYDVFLCYNSKDRPAVEEIGQRLRERGILPWLDIWAMQPGTQWQKELYKRLKTIKSAAVFIGPGGPGPWQDLEVPSLLQQIAKRNRPLIPVILPGRKGDPRFPPFLALWHAVDMRQPVPDPFEQLIWGITGKRDPSPDTG